MMLSHSALCFRYQTLYKDINEKVERLEKLEKQGGSTNGLSLPSPTALFAASLCNSLTNRERCQAVGAVHSPE